MRRLWMEMRYKNLTAAQALPRACEVGPLPPYSHVHICRGVRVCVTSPPLGRTLLSSGVYWFSVCFFNWILCVRACVRACLKVLNDIFALKCTADDRGDPRCPSQPCPFAFYRSDVDPSLCLPDRKIALSDAWFVVLMTFQVISLLVALALMAVLLKYRKVCAHYCSEQRNNHKLTNIICQTKVVNASSSRFMVRMRTFRSSLRVFSQEKSPFRFVLT
jgi:hypothetical protein